MNYCPVALIILKILLKAIVELHTVYMVLGKIVLYEYKFISVFHSLVDFKFRLLIAFKMVINNFAALVAKTLRVGDVFTHAQILFFEYT